jgi:hypothetical protein
MNIENRIIELGLVLPAPRAPAFAYAAVSLHANLAWVSGQLPWHLDGSLPNGKLGAEISIEEGQAAELTIFNRTEMTNLTPENNKSKSSNSAFMNQSLTGKVIATINKGILTN